MPSNAGPTGAQILASLPASLPQLFTPSDVIRVVEVAKKYNQPEVSSYDPAELGGPFPFVAGADQTGNPHHSHPRVHHPRRPEQLPLLEE